jgi:hypothetical protein
MLVRLRRREGERGGMLRVDVVYAYVVVLNKDLAFLRFGDGEISLVFENLDSACLLD